MCYDYLFRLSIVTQTNNTIMESLLNLAFTACSRKVLWQPSSPLAELQVTSKSLFFDHFQKIPNSEEFFCTGKKLVAFLLLSLQLSRPKGQVYNEINIWRGWNISPPFQLKHDIKNARNQLIRDLDQDSPFQQPVHQVKHNGAYLISLHPKCDRHLITLYSNTAESSTNIMRIKEMITDQRSFDC